MLMRVSVSMVFQYKSCELHVDDVHLTFKTVVCMKCRSCYL